MTGPECSAAERHAAVILAGKHIDKLNYGKRGDKVLVILRKVMREAALAVGKQGGIAVRVRLK